MQLKYLLRYLLIIIAIFSTPTYAYIGPGAGAGTIAVVIGVIASVVMAFFAILWYPVKRMIKKRKAKTQIKEESAEAKKMSEADS